MARFNAELQEAIQTSRYETQTNPYKPVTVNFYDEPLAVNPGGAVTTDVGSVTQGKVNVPAPVSYGVREQAFRFSISGLRPSTNHYLYFERRLVDSTKIKPVGGLLGSTILTDANGKVDFDFFYAADLSQGTSPAEIAQYASSLYAGTKEVVVSTLNQANLPADYASSSTSYFAGYITVSVKEEGTVPAGVEDWRIGAGGLGTE